MADLRKWVSPQHAILKSRQPIRIRIRPWYLLIWSTLSSARPLRAPRSGESNPSGFAFYSLDQNADFSLAQDSYPKFLMFENRLTNLYAEARRRLRRLNPILQVWRRRSTIYLQALRSRSGWRLRKQMLGKLLGMGRVVMIMGRFDAFEHGRQRWA